MAKYHILKHFHTVNKHRFLVFIHCIKCGIPWRGLLHDLSKYSFKEFIPSSKNYLGNRSPIANERKNSNGYSFSFIHHTRHNKHHYEYWVDITLGDAILIPMPYKYALECCCDMISASKVYNKKNFNRSLPLEFFLRVKDRSMMHTSTQEFLLDCLTRYKELGFKGLKKKYTKAKYKEIVEKNAPTEVIPIYSTDNKIIHKPFDESYLSHPKVVTTDIEQTPKEEC